jgi:hypothetical protein
MAKKSPKDEQPKDVACKVVDEAASTPAKQLEPFKWKPGQSGNPAGRPKGSKQRLSESFISAMCDDFELHGQTVIDTVRAEKPSDYLKIIASIVPKEFTVRTETLEDMSDEELLDSLEQVRSIATALVGAKASERSGAKSRDKAARGKPN